jgi:hypothetical protein
MCWRIVRSVWYICKQSAQPFHAQIHAEHLHSASSGSTCPAQRTMSCPVDYKTYTDTLQVTTAQFGEDLVSQLIVIQSSKSSLNLAPLYASA